MLLVVFSFGCNGSLKEVKEFNDDGSLYKKYSIDKDSLIQGKLNIYYEDGSSIFEESHYTNGELHGKRTLYYKNGNPEIIEHYEADILTDTLLVFFPSGGLKRKAPYHDGILSGVLTVYYENGQVKEEVSFAENLENGPFTEFHENGKIKWKGVFLNGDNEFGELLQHDTSGQLIRKLMCDSMAICRSTWKFENGDTI